MYINPTLLIYFSEEDKYVQANISGYGSIRLWKVKYIVFTASYSIKLPSITDQIMRIQTKASVICGLMQSGVREYRPMGPLATRGPTTDPWCPQSVRATNTRPFQIRRQSSTHNNIQITLHFFCSFHCVRLNQMR